MFQLNSFETELSVPGLASEGGPASCRAVFIRAPAIVDAGPSVEVLAEYKVPAGSARHSEQVFISSSSLNNLAGPHIETLTELCNAICS